MKRQAEVATVFEHGWMSESENSTRVIGGAKTGHVNPTVSDDCKYCTG